MKVVSSKAIPWALFHLLFPFDQDLHDLQHLPEAGVLQKQNLLCSVLSTAESNFFTLNGPCHHTLNNLSDLPTLFGVYSQVT